MNINDVFPSEFLKASDLGGKKIKLVIERVELTTLGNEQKPVTYFEGKEKGLVLNKTNAMTLAAAYGPETNNWVGKSVSLYGTQVNYQGQMVAALRLEAVLPEVDSEEMPF